MIIAECGHNFGTDIGMAKRLIREAKTNGADIAKFQLYDTDAIVDHDHHAYSELKESQLSHAQWLDLVQECDETDIECLASVFDVERVKWCQEVNMRRYKVASRSIYDEDLIEAIIRTGRDIIMSLGKVNGRGVPKLNCDTKVDYLYCVAKYPTPLSELNLGRVDFRKYSGISDHTKGIEAAMVALSRGARIIEKHFTFDRTMPGCDHAGSMTPAELRQLVSFADKVKEMA